jgi:hypothetical protein
MMSGRLGSQTRSSYAWEEVIGSRSDAVATQDSRPIAAIEMAGQER